MQNCSKCGSYAINHHLHGRDGSDPDLCDVCFWRKRAVPVAPALLPLEPQRPGSMNVNAGMSFNRGWIAEERAHGIRPAAQAAAKGAAS